jgi:hypothetical protein
MTTPSPDAFDYTDDSVIARVSIDVPSQALTDITQLSTAMGAMRTQLEAIARAQGDWLDYLQQIPVITERANQAYRDQITQLERISYIQNELGTSGGMGGPNVSPSIPLRTSGSPGASGYSTAAPAGYTDPFRGMSAGTGAERGSPGAAGIAGQLSAMAAEDPRMVPNAASARGQAVNPSLLGGIGGAIGLFAGTQGQGGPTPGAENTGQDSSGRDSTGVPNPSTGGAQDGAGEQHPPTNNPLGSVVQNAVAGLAIPFGSEIKKALSGGRVGQLLGSMGSMGAGALGKMFGGPGTTGGGLGLGTKLLRGAGIAGLGIAALNASQSIGEQVTRLQQVGSEEGGDYATGLKEDIHARMIGLDPFLSTEEARKAIQIPMSEGFKGDSRDEIRDFLINNFKELGISMAQSASIEFSSLKGKELTDENVLSTRSSNEATLNVMKELAGADGNGMSLSQRTNQLEQLMKVLTSSGGNPESIQRSALQWQEGFGNDSLALRESGAKIIGSTMRSPGLMALVGQKLGVTGMYGPEAMEAELTDMGYSETEIAEMAAAEVVRYIPKGEKPNNQIQMFMGLMRQNGIDLDWPEAKDLYRKVTGKKSSSEQASEVINRQAGRGKSGEKSRTGGPGTGNAQDAEWADSHPGYQPSENAERVADNFASADQQKDMYAPAGQRPRQLPQNADQIPQRQTINTSGLVTGNLTVTVDQSGRATAPPTIQLTGTQRSVNAGVGSATLNNTPAGESHAYNTFPGGPS